jgi:hypothetical protein
MSDVGYVNTPRDGPRNHDFFPDVNIATSCERKLIALLPPNRPFSWRLRIRLRGAWPLGQLQRVFEALKIEQVNAGNSSSEPVAA